MTETELAEIKCITLTGENVVISAAHFDALLSVVRELQRDLKNARAGWKTAGDELRDLDRQIETLQRHVAEQRELINEQRSTIIALMMGVEEHTGKEGTTPVLRYIEELERQVHEREDGP